MADDLDLDLDENNQEEIISRKDKRIRSLSEKYESSEKEKADIAKAKEELELARAKAEKERDFYKGFTNISTKYQGANEYQDKIWEKVQGGYDVEDATIAILAKEGKYTPQIPVPERESAIGGSAPTNLVGSGQKGPEEMSQTERLSALQEMADKGEFRL